MQIRWIGAHTSFFVFHHKAAKCVFAVLHLRSRMRSFISHPRRPLLSAVAALIKASTLFKRRKAVRKAVIQALPRAEVVRFVSGIRY